MALLPLNDEADCLADQHENRVGFPSVTTTQSRSPLPRERFSPSTRSSPSASISDRLLSAREQTPGQEPDSCGMGYLPCQPYYFDRRRRPLVLEQPKRENLHPFESTGYAGPRRIS